MSNKLIKHGGRNAMYAQQDTREQELYANTDMTLEQIRAELRGMVDTEEQNAKPHGMYARRNGFTLLLGRYPNFDVARQAVRDNWDDVTIHRECVSELNDELGRFTYTNEHGTMWIYVAPCDRGE